MKVKVWVEAEVETVYLADVLASLAESEHMPSMLSAINAAYAIFKHVPDAVIAAMTEAQRTKISGALQKQVDRFVLPQPAIAKALGEEQ